jgi:lambda family phage portal protein
VEEIELKATWLDKTIGWFSPKWGAQRTAYRNAQQLQANYTSAYPTRVSTYWSQSESISGIPHLNLPVHRYMRDRARSLIENNVLASSILNRATENIIGNGFELQVLTADPAWNKKCEELFRHWFPVADFYGRSWITHQRLLCNSLLRDGDIGALLLSRGQIQQTEGDYISSPYGKQPSAFLHDGIELDTYGKVKKYYVMYFVDLKNRDWQPINPKDFIFVANRRRVTQYRGESYFAQSFDLFDQQKGYIDAVVLAQKIAACLAVFIKLNSPTGDVQGLNYGKNGKGQSQREFRLEPGMVQALLPNESIEQITPQQPGGGFSENVRMLIRLLGLSFGLPLEYVLLDFSQVSGNTAKASALQAQRAFETIQKLLIDEYYCRVYRWRVSKWINEGLLEDRPDAFHHNWHPAPWPYLDPLKEVQAQMLEIDAGLTSEKRAIMSRGGNPDQIMAERAIELKTKRASDIPIYHTNYVIELGTKLKVSTEENDGDQTNSTTVNDSNVSGENETAVNQG